MKKVVLFVIVLLLFGFLAGCAQEAVEEVPDVEPDDDIFDFPENNEAMAEILAIITELGERLNAEDGYYGDLHDAVVEAGNRQNPEHDELYAIFNEWVYEVGATYLYSFIDDGGDNNLIIVDGAEPEDMDPYGYAYPKEPWTVEAFETGQPTVAKATWMDDYGYGLQKSGFAPIFNSEGEISFLLGIDYPVPQLEEFPEIMD